MEGRVSAAAHGEARRTGWRRLWGRRTALALVGLVVLVWALIPAVRSVSLVGNWHGRGAVSTAIASAAGVRAEDVTFAARDGVRLAGWFVAARPDAPTVILVHGFKGTRTEMLPYAHFLSDAGYNVLLYDSRGCGASAGWGIGLGAREADDVRGAVAYLEGRRDLTAHRYGVLGVSLGAGTAILAAADEPLLRVVVADSAWADEDLQLGRLYFLPVGPIALPLLPYGPALADALAGTRIADARPRLAIARIAPRAVLLIHSADDANATTSAAGERALYAAAGAPKDEWIAPSGGHAGALAASPADYERRVLSFLAAHLHD